MIYGVTSQFLGLWAWNCYWWQCHWTLERVLRILILSRNLPIFAKFSSKVWILRLLPRGCAIGNGHKTAIKATLWPLQSPLVLKSRFSFFLLWWKEAQVMASSTLFELTQVLKWNRELLFEPHSIEKRASATSTNNKSSSTFSRTT